LDSTAADNSPITQPIQQFHTDLVDIKFFITTKLFELAQICLDETNIYSIILIFEQIIACECTSSIEFITPVTTTLVNNLGNIVTPKAQAVMLSPPNSTGSGNNNYGFLNTNMAYMSKIVQGLIDMFEKYFCGERCLTRSCFRIFNILTSYLDTFYRPSKLNKTVTSKE